MRFDSYNFFDSTFSTIAGPRVIESERHLLKMARLPAEARAAVAAGCDGLFMEVHDQPDRALSDSGTQWPFDQFEGLVTQLLAFRRTYVETSGSHVANQP